MPARLPRFVRQPELLLLTTFAAITRFWHLYSPRAVVFDELWTEVFSGHYLAGSYYFDLHPPLAKLIVAGAARLFGITLAVLDPAPTVELRLIPALLGTLLVPLAYLLLRELGTSRRIATLGALFLLVDNALLVESRLLLPEPFLLFFGLTAVTAYAASRKRVGRRRWMLLGTAGLFAGCAVSVKWTGASALGLILATWFVEGVMRHAPRRRFLVEGAMLVALPAIVYVAAFALHFALLPRTGAVYDVPMSPRFQATLIGNTRYDPRVHMSFVDKLADAHRAMMAGNNALRRTTHTGSSKWYTWPVMKHPIGYWSTDATRPYSPIIILLGNPLVWWGSLAATLVAIAVIVPHRERAAAYEFAFLFLLGGYLLNFVPFAAIDRIMFLYHYLFALIFIAMLGALSIGVLAGWTTDDDADFGFASRRSAMLYWGIVGAVVVSFVYYLPFSYAWPISQASYDMHFWLLHPL